jgi:hypothetical protein
MSIRGPKVPMNLGIKEQAYCALILVSPVISRGALCHDVRDLYQRKVELWVRNGRSNLAYDVTSTGIVGVFYMLQTCHMGPTALLPLRRKVC